MDVQAAENLVDCRECLERECAECSQLVSGCGSNLPRFCSTACRMRAYRRREQLMAANHGD